VPTGQESMSKKTRAQNREIVSHILGVLQVESNTGGGKN